MNVVSSLDKSSVVRPDIEVLTVGHSTLPYEGFLELLRIADVEAIADVRSMPFSKHFPHFNRDVLKEQLNRDGIAYVFLGNDLGGRPSDPTMFHEGVADYEKMANAQNFHRGLKRLLEGSKRYRVALMCSEHNPLDCHRCLLVGRVLHDQNVPVRHILGHGELVTHECIEDRLLEISRKEHADFFLSAQERLADAYRKRSTKVAFAERNDSSDDALEMEP